MLSGSKQQDHNEQTSEEVGKLGAYTLGDLKGTPILGPQRLGASEEVHIESIDIHV